MASLSVVLHFYKPTILTGSTRLNFNWLSNQQVEAPIFASLVNGFDYIEADNRKILNYGWVNFPLAYVQVATLSVYAYLLSSLLGKAILIN